MAKGRPPESTRYEAADRTTLQKVARLIMTLQAPSALAAIKMVVGDDPATIRRLQRKWKNQGPSYQENIQSEWYRRRWDRWEAALKAEHPELHSKIIAFASSDIGRETLKGQHPFSVPIKWLWEQIEQSGFRGEDRARHVFDELWASWNSHPLGPDRTFLQALSELIAQRAKRLAADVLKEEKQ